MYPIRNMKKEAIKKIIATTTNTEEKIKNLNNLLDKEIGKEKEHIIEIEKDEAAINSDLVDLKDIEINLGYDS